MLDSQAIFKAYSDVTQVTETQAFKHDENGKAIDFTSQKKFLISLGIQQRAEMISKNKTFFESSSFKKKKELFKS